MLKTFFGLVILLSVCSSSMAQKGLFLTAEEFYQQAFTGLEASPQTLWINNALRDEAEAILGHRFPGLRIRYRGANQRTAWILEEIGKELPITMGVVIENNKVSSFDILEYRESRGGEVRYPFFTKQFSDLVLLEKNGRKGLSGGIDGITGATLSVRAVKKVVTLALFLHGQTPFAAEQEELNNAFSGPTP